MPAAADITVTFTEDAPADVFELRSTSCDTGRVRLVIDLSTAQADVFFDTSGAGLGDGTSAAVQVLQGRVAMTEMVDGDKTLALEIAQFGPDQPVRIAVDLDDRNDPSPLGRTLISGLELAGATVRATVNDAQLQGRFDKTGRAVLVGGGACLG